jgi:hypothetical protein
MKKIVLFTSLTFLSVVLNSQLKLGVSAGVQTSNLSKVESFGLTSTAKTTPHFGIVGRYNLPKNFVINSGLLFHQIAYHKTNVGAINFDGNDLGEVDQHTINYLQIPLTVSYKVDIGKTNHFFVGLGAAFNAGLGDKITIQRTVPFTVTDPYIRGTNGLSSTYWAANFLFGYQMKKVGFQLDLQNNVSSVFEGRSNFGVYNVRLSLQYFIKQ